MAWYEIPGAEQDVALCTCARLSRNLEAFPFPARLEPAGAKEVISAVGAVLTETALPPLTSRKFPAPPPARWSKNAMPVRSLSAKVCRTPCT